MKKNLLVMLSVLLCVGCLSAQTNVGESVTNQRNDFKKAVSEFKTIQQNADTQEAKSQIQEQQAPVVLAYVGASIRGGQVSKNKVIANPFIRAAVKDPSSSDLHWKVQSYRVIFIYQGIEEPPMACTGSSFSEEVMKKILQAESGTIIVFQNIKVKSEAGERTLDEIVIRLL